MEIIARKTKSPLIMYVVVFVIGLFLLVFMTNLFSTIMPGLILIIFSFIYLIGYLCFPKDPISFNGYDSLIFPKGESVKLDEIVKVKFIQARTRNTSFKYGRVIITTQ